MPQINILNILQGDNQSTIVDKINYNFDQILSTGGGPQGQQGIMGPTGPIGPQGAQGVQGLQGASGTKWFVQGGTAPSVGNITGSNPFLYPTLGDYWLDTDSSNQDIWIYAPTGATIDWIQTGYGLAQGDIFQNLSNIGIPGGTAQGILIAGDEPDKKSLILSDKRIDIEYFQGGENINNINFEDAKLKIATKDSREKLISFSRSDFDTGTGKDGNGVDNPYIKWDNTTYNAGPAYYNISFFNPTGSIGIVSNGQNGGGINSLAFKEITQQSNTENIIHKTSAVEKGIFNIFNGNKGFLEVGPQQGTTPSNLGYSPLYVNNTGAGFGLGSINFNQATNQARRLAVNGNVSIGKTISSTHLGDMFIGAGSLDNNNKGALFVEGHVGIGATSPNFGYGGIASTGNAESKNVYPQLFVTSPNEGPVLQIRNKGGQSHTARTTIGNGVFDVTEGNEVAGGYSDITQEAYFGDTSIQNNYSKLISYQHKIASSEKTGATAPVFGITTYGGTGYTSVDNIAYATQIQTKNSNKDLIIRSNGTTPENNRVLLGTNNNNSISINGGNASNKTKASITIGQSSELYIGVTGGLTSYATFPNGVIPNDTKSLSSDAHALVVSGIQTIGTTSPRSAFATGPNTNKCAGAVSMLKIHRVLGTEIDDEVPTRLFITGPRKNNYPNGIEISSYESRESRTGNANDSVAIAVGSKGDYDLFPRPYHPISLGFAVSNDGRNVSIGGCIDYNSSLEIHASSGATAINTGGNIYANNITASGNISGNGIIPVGGMIMLEGNVIDFNSTGLANLGWTLFNGENLTIGSGTFYYIKRIF